MTPSVEVNGKEHYFLGFIMMLIVLGMGWLCILKIGGTTAIVAVVIYYVAIGLGSITTLEQLFNPTKHGMGMGVVLEPDGRKGIDLELYDKFVFVYEYRFSNIWFWMAIPIILTWPAIFLVGGFPIAAYIYFAMIIVSEIANYRVYKTIKENKTIWGAAAYINEINNFFNGKKKG